MGEDIDVLADTIVEAEHQDGAAEAEVELPNQFRNVPSTVKNANHDNRIRIGPIVDRVTLMEGDAKP